MMTNRPIHAAGVRRWLLAVVAGCLTLATVHAQEHRPPEPRSQGKPLELPAAETAITTSSDAAETVSPQPWTGGRYRLTPSDVIELRFPYVPEFDQTVTIQPDGYISLRGLGDLRVQGRTLPELKAMLNEAYAEILREPVITIVLREFEKPYFVVSGEVTRPGKYELRGATTLTQGLVLAGGYTSSARHSEIVLFRHFSTGQLEVKQVDVKKMYASHNLTEDPLLRPGDTIFVPKSTMAKIEPFIPRPGFGFYIPF